MELVNAVQVIQAMLAPGIMISACGLLILGTNNKYSMVVSRIRLLDDEKRKLEHARARGTMAAEGEDRLGSLDRQVEVLARRFVVVRNTLLAYCGAVALFIGSSLAIGAHFASRSRALPHLAMFLFLGGMLAVLLGILHAAREILIGYKVIQIELADR